jgi:RHH-type transcriptional regulator, rel operon repressor / antitoxin RelB
MPMEVPLSVDLQAKLTQLASREGRNTTALVIEAIERMVNYEEWFLREVDAGLVEAERGQLIDHASVREMIDKRYPS